MNLFLVNKTGIHLNYFVSKSIILNTEHGSITFLPLKFYTDVTICKCKNN